MDPDKLPEPEALDAPPAPGRRPTLMPSVEPEPSSGATVVPFQTLEPASEPDGPAVPDAPVAHVAPMPSSAPPPPRTRAVTPATPAGPVPLGRGVRLGRWQLERKLGDGATAQVWAARHTQLGSPVAIKIFHDHNRSFHTVLGEARAAAGIPSPYVIWVYDVDTYEGHHAIVMELCAADGSVGRSLKEVVVDSPAHAAQLIAQAARGVEAAHVGQVFHKDIKPANILIHPEDGRAQITDFGLANPVLWRALTAQQARRSAQSTISMDISPSDHPLGDPHSSIRGRIRFGTPEFMAPEQAGGLRPDIDAADPALRPYLVAMDVYGLGATLYAILAGVAPYPHGDLDPTTATAQQIMEQVVSVPPVPLRTVAPEVPRRLAAIVDKAMHLDPLARYASAEALANELEDWLAERPISLDNAVTASVVHLSRERAKVGILVALALVTLGSSAVVARNLDEIQSQETLITEQADALDSRRAELEALGEERAALEGSLQETKGALTSTQSALDAKSGELEARLRELRARSAKVAALSQELTAASSTLEEKSEALSEAELALVETDAAKGALQGSLANTELELASTEDKLASAQVALSAAEGEVVRLKASLQIETDHSRDLAQQVTKLEGDLSRDRGELAKAMTAVGDARKEADAVQLKLRMSEGEVAGLREENAHLRRLLEGGGQ
jgi:serine/threonine protein kinase